MLRISFAFHTLRMYITLRKYLSPSYTIGTSKMSIQDTVKKFTYISIDVDVNNLQ